MPRNPWLTRSLLACLVVALFGVVMTVFWPSEVAYVPEPAPVEPTIVVAVAVAVEPTLEPTVMPTAVPPTATSTPAKLLTTTGDPQTVPSEPFLIANTLGRGMSLRRAPTSADLIRSWPDGTVLEGLGAQQEARGWTWAWVRDPEGNAGWIPTQFLVRSPDEAPPPLPLTPAPPEIPGRTMTAAGPTATPGAAAAPSAPKPAAALPAPAAGLAAPASGLAAPASGLTAPVPGLTAPVPGLTAPAASGGRAPSLPTGLR